jgi:5'(3')-deoxyribonucleotidase
MEEMLIEKVRQQTILYDTKSSDNRDHHMRTNAWEEIGKELKIKRET